MPYFPFARPSPWTVAVLTVLATFITYALWPKKTGWNPKGKHCYVTGASSGLGKELAILLAEKGAHVSLVARDKERLAQVVEEAKSKRQSENQKIEFYSHSLDDAAESAAALDAASKPFDGRAPDAVFLCAGRATPGFFVEQTAESLKKGMDDGYWVQAWSALAAAKRMARDRKGGRIIFVSSAMGLLGFAGYSSYAPGKHALRGLAETLRNELLLYSIWVHIYFPGTLLTPGFEAEEKVKPFITKKIEQQGEAMKPREAAEGLIYGVEQGNFHIANDMTVNIVRAATRGASPMNTVILDTVYEILGWMSLPVYRARSDDIVVSERVKHRQYLQSQDVKL